MDQPPLAAALDAVIHHVSATIGMIGLADIDATPWLFTRCSLRVLRFEGGGRDPLDLDLAFADFRMLPEGFPGRAKLAATMVNAHLSGAGWNDRETFARALALAEVADGDPAPLPGWLQTSAVVRAHSLVLAALDSARGFRPRRALAEVEWYALLFGDMAPHGQFIEMSRLALAFLVAALDNDILAVDRLVAQTASFRDRQDPESPLWDRLDVVAVTGRIFPAMIRGDGESIRRTFASAGRMVGPLPTDDPLRVQFEQLRRAAEPFTGALSEQDGPDPQADGDSAGESGS